jgi:hypothetical protein
MKKGFDSVEMKSEIQRQIREEYEGIPEEEAHRLEWEKILADPVLGPFVKKARVARRRSAA